MLLTSTIILITLVRIICCMLFDLFCCVGFAHESRLFINSFVVFVLGKFVVVHLYSSFCICPLISSLG